MEILKKDLHIECLKPIKSVTLQTVFQRTKEAIKNPVILLSSAGLVTTTAGIGATNVDVQLFGYFPILVAGYIELKKRDII